MNYYTNPNLCLSHLPWNSNRITFIPWYLSSHRQSPTVPCLMWIKQQIKTLKRRQRLDSAAPHELHFKVDPVVNLSVSTNRQISTEHSISTTRPFFLFLFLQWTQVSFLSLTDTESGFRSTCLQEKGTVLMVKPSLCIYLQIYMSFYRLNTCLCYSVHSEDKPFTH